MDIPTVWVILKASGDRIKINEEDFNEEAHEMCAQEPEEQHNNNAGLREMLEACATKKELLEFAESKGLDIGLGTVAEPDDKLQHTKMAEIIELILSKLEP